MDRHTARGLIFRDGKILLMERWRDGQHYFSIPGGGIEGGETPKQTVVRELNEETSVVVQPLRQVLEMVTSNGHHYIFICEYVSGEPKMQTDSEEAERTTETNQFLPRWVTLQEMDALTLGVWQPLKSLIIDGLNNGFAGEVKVVHADSTR